jgi:hypothetical protein
MKPRGKDATRGTLEACPTVARGQIAQGVAKSEVINGCSVWFDRAKKCLPRGRAFCSLRNERTI